jgi:two-component system, chemotaxis family, sensor kinase CheA
MGDMTNEGATCRPASTSASSTRSSSRRPARTSRAWSRCCSTWTSSNADDEELNAIFRCAHSVKGGAATFGFNDVAELTHQMETLLDKLRRHELAPTAAMVDVLLASGDALKAQLARHQGNGAEVIDTTDLLATIRAPGRRPAHRRAVAPGPWRQPARRPPCPASSPAAGAAPAGASARWS